MAGFWYTIGIPKAEHNQLRRHSHCMIYSLTFTASFGGFLSCGRKWLPFRQPLSAGKAPCNGLRKKTCVLIQAIKRDSAFLSPLPFCMLGGNLGHRINPLNDCFDVGPLGRVRLEHPSDEVVQGRGVRGARRGGHLMFPSYHHCQLYTAPGLAQGHLKW